jgi:subtilisin family serine protease
MMKIGAGVMLLLLAVSACSDDGTGPGGGPPPGDRLEGASGGLASTAIPRLAYEPRLEDYRQALALVEAQLGSLPVIVTAAGNESNTAVGTQPASYLSDFNNAGLVQGAANIIVVEALDLEAGVATRSPSSNVGGHVSAPGGGILSTIPTNTYAFSDGTSYAAPHVAGLAGPLRIGSDAAARDALQQRSAYPDPRHGCAGARRGKCPHGRVRSRGGARQR